MAYNRFVPLMITQSRAIPSASVLEIGELAINPVDGLLYTRTTGSGETIVLLNPPTAQDSASYAITASYAVNGGGGGPFDPLVPRAYTGSFTGSITGSISGSSASFNTFRTYNNNTAIDFYGYRWQATSEYGMSFPLVGVRNGRLDMWAASGKVEYRVNTAGSEFNIYNVADDRFYMKMYSPWNMALGHYTTDTAPDAHLYVSLSAAAPPSNFIALQSGSGLVASINARGGYTGSSFSASNNGVGFVGTASYALASLGVGGSAPDTAYYIVSGSNPSLSNAFRADSTTAVTWSFSGGAVTLSITSASYALTASYAANGGSGPAGDPFPYTGSAIISGSLDVTGPFTATTKSFKIRHKTIPDRSLIYAVLEGPEHAVYVRGRLVHSSIIELPKEWSWLVDENSISVQLTPIGEHQQLYVKQTNSDYIEVGTNSGVPIHCYYTIFAVRRDVPPLRTVE